MRVVIVSFILWICVGCAEYSLPSKEVSNAKLALVKVDTKESRKYFAEDLKNTKLKFKKLQNLLSNKEYQEAKILAQEIQADARELQNRVELKSVEVQLKKKQKDLEDLEEKSQSKELL